MIAKRKIDKEYLQEIEELARTLVKVAINENSFEVFLDEGDKTPLQQAITDLAHNIRYTHYEGDGCLDH